MAFNDQAKNMGSQGPRRSIFRDGVNYKYMTGKSPITFRIQPAFHPGSADPQISWIPCLDPSGNLTDWGAIIKVVRFVGHGTGGAMKRDLLSLKTFETSGSPVWCPLDTLYRAIMSDPQTWGYLVDGTPDPANPKSRGKDAAFGRISPFLLTNILDVMGNPPQNQIGIFTQSASGKLIDPREGLVFTPNGTPGIEEAIAKNYMAAYANGDITSPHDAPLLVLSKMENRGEFSSYTISLAVDAQRRVIRRPIDTTVMAQRYDLSKLENILNVPTEAELVQSLVELLSGRSPHGYHEHALLRSTFPTHQIPEPPLAPCASSTVQSGFQAPSHGVPPAQSIPGMPPPHSYGGPAAQPAPQAFQPPTIPGMVPPQGYGQSVTTTPMPMPQSAPQPLPQSVPPAPIPQGVPGMPAAAPIPPAGSIPGAGAAPAVPGDPVQFNSGDFLTRVRDQKLG